jgi:dihydrodipicolinate synthase/N-acetylneuraminate lyase
VGNFLPKAYNDLFEAGINGNEAEAERLQQETIEIGKINTAGLTLGQSLAGLKVIMKECGLCDTYMLPPLTELDEATVKKIKTEIKPYI